ncbi:hypothetical protein [Nocardia pseudobrasiliensis]|uniref:hypothetical protein n=1 Tax=Nocardia pseudobrasiliensis TaxID=45979 RepID=UPI0008324A7A|nr:hypothetical protein [Nocardia pseudobrasiliensis]
MFGPAILSGPALAEPLPSGCNADYSVPDQITLECAPGAGAGTHAYIRCRDLGGLQHVRIGTPIGPDGGSSRAICATGETAIPA